MGMILMFIVKGQKFICEFKRIKNDMKLTKIDFRKIEIFVMKLTKRDKQSL